MQVPPADRRRHAPATQRNREPILAVFRDILPADGTVLEIGSGTGEHVAFFAPLFPSLVWQPSDPDPGLRDSIAAWADASGAGNIRPPLEIDTRTDDWGIDRADAILCANVIHITPWAVCEGLLRGAGRILTPGGLLSLYGPFKRDGRHTAPSNEQFDMSLRSQDPSWGVRDLTDVTGEAAANGLVRDSVIEMPSNNLIVVFKRPSGDAG